MTENSYSLIMNSLWSDKDLNHTQVRVLGFIISHNYKTNKELAVRYIAKCINMATSTVELALKHLKNLEYIKIICKGSRKQNGSIIKAITHCKVDPKLKEKTVPKNDTVKEENSSAQKQVSRNSVQCVLKNSTVSVLKNSTIELSTKNKLNKHCSAANFLNEKKKTEDRKGCVKELQSFGHVKILLSSVYENVQRKWIRDKGAQHTGQVISKNICNIPASHRHPSQLTQWLDDLIYGRTPKNESPAKLEANKPPVKKQGKLSPITDLLKTFDSGFLYGV